MNNYLLTNSIYSDRVAENYLENYLNIGTFFFYRDAEIAVSNLQKEGFTVRKIAVIGDDYTANELNESMYGFLIWKDIFKVRQPKDWLKCITISDSDSNISKKLMKALLQLGISEAGAIKYAVEVETGKSAVFISGTAEDIRCLQQNFFSYSKSSTNTNLSNIITMNMS